jgi:hypothetical protein
MERVPPPQRQGHGDFTTEAQRARRSREKRSFKSLLSQPTVKRPDTRLLEAKIMKTRTRTKFVQEGDYIAAVEVELQYDETGWALYLTVADAEKLDDVREALRKKDLKTASRLARVFMLTPVAL